MAAKTQNEEPGGHREAGGSWEVSRGTRFRFSRIWGGFLKSVDEDRIPEAERSLTEMLDSRPVAGQTFLDIGSGSGLFSRAPARLGIREVRSLD